MAALAASLVLHGLLLFAASQRGGDDVSRPEGLDPLLAPGQAQPPRPPAARAQPRSSLVWIEATAVGGTNDTLGAAREESTRAALPRQPPRKPRRRPALASVAATPSAPTTPSTGTIGEATAGVTPTAPAAAAPLRGPVDPVEAADAARLTEAPALEPPSAADGTEAPSGALAPPSARLLPSWALLGPAPEARPGGRTVFNDGGTRDEAAERAGAEAMAAAAIDQWARDAFAQAKLESGRIDPGLVELRRRLAAAVDRTSRSPSGSAASGRTAGTVARDLAVRSAAGWLESATRYGRSGAAVDAPPRAGAIPELPSQLERALESGARGATEDVLRLKVGAALRELGEGKLGSQLYAELEIAHGLGGAAERCTLVRSSGEAPFDALVLESAGRAMRELAVADAGTSAVRRSLWGFFGRVTYQRAAKDLDLVRDGLYVAAMLRANLLVGGFDEVKGAANIVDPRNPRYEATVKLLRVDETE